VAKRKQPEIDDQIIIYEKTMKNLDSKSSRVRILVGATVFILLAVGLYQGLGTKSVSRTPQASTTSKPTVKPTPVVVKPTPVVVKPTPAVVKPTPAVVKPTPAVVKPTVKPTVKPVVKPTTPSNSTYPRMEGNVVPINNTNTPYTAGKDIPVGLYHSTNSVCGFRVRMVNKSLFNVGIYEKGSTLVELKAGEQVLNSDCSIVFGPPTPQSVILPGAHLVGVDIEPGVYHAENNFACRFAVTTKAELTRGNETIKVGFGNLNEVRDMLIPGNSEGVLFASECGQITKVS
jgi:hypothetical protein